MTAIQASQHEQFCKTIDTLTGTNEELSLAGEKMIMEKLYTEYREKIRELQQLITEYKRIQLRTRKKMAGFQRMQRPARESVRTAAKAGLSNPAVP
jgi:hypothetical protein